MTLKFNRFERVAGIFVGVALLGALMGTFSVAVRKGWFSSRVTYETELPSADGIHPGTVVQMSGLRAGSVDEIELISASKVKVKLSVMEKFTSQIREDSTIQVLRPFIIGDKVLEVSVGSLESPVLGADSQIPTVSSFDVMDVLSGKKMGPVLGTLEALAENLRVLGEAFADPKRTQAMVEMFDRLQPLIKNLNQMAIEMARIGQAANKNKRVDVVVENLVSLTSDLNQVVPALVKEMPDLGAQMAQIVKNLNVLTTEFQKLTPAISAVAPDLPQASKRAVEALDETVVLLKALQKSFMLRGNVKDVREEEELRQPASK